MQLINRRKSIKLALQILSVAGVCFGIRRSSAAPGGLAIATGEGALFALGQEGGGDSCGGGGGGGGGRGDGGDRGDGGLCRYYVSGGGDFDCLA